MKNAEPQKPKTKFDKEPDRAIILTADDAILAKLSCVQRGYYEDPFIHRMARGATGLRKESNAFTGRGNYRCLGTSDSPTCWNDANCDRSTTTDKSARNLNREFSPRHKLRGQNETPMNGSLLPPDVTSVEPIIRRGTHARVCAIDRTIRAFLSLPLLPTSPSVPTASNPQTFQPSVKAAISTHSKANSFPSGVDARVTRQVVILGAGRDTTYLRYRFGYLKHLEIPDLFTFTSKQEDGPLGDSTTPFLETKGGVEQVEEIIRWYEVDHPSVIEQKAKSWLPSCVPEGYEYNCTKICASNHASAAPGSVTNNRVSSKQVTDDETTYRNISPTSCSFPSSVSYEISFPPSKVSSVTCDFAHKMNDTEDEKSKHCCFSSYHIIGHDLRSPPASLFEILSHPRHGYDRSIPTLFVLECVAMYLPEKCIKDLLCYLAMTPSAPTPSPQNRIVPSVDPFVAVVSYDPIPCHDRFGRVMIENLQQAGITGWATTKEGGHVQIPLSLEKTLTLSDQLGKLIQSGFDVAVGCHMLDAYDHGILSVKERSHAARCDMLDELEEFIMLMKHYCLLIGVSTGRAENLGINSANKEPAEDCKERKNRSKSDQHKNNYGKDGAKSSLGLHLCSVGKQSLVGFQEDHCMVIHR